MKWRNPLDRFSLGKRMFIQAVVGLIIIYALKILAVFL